MNKIMLSENKPLRISLKLIIILFILVVIVLLQKSCTHTSEETSKTLKKPKQPTAVVVSPIRRRDVPVYLTALGSVTPLDTVTVKAQVNGQLLRVLFQEGQMVQAKDRLAEIDARPYKALLKQYEGQLVRDKALLANAKTDLKRYKKLHRQDAIPEQTLATQKALVEQYEGVVKSDQGLVETARLNVEFCSIVSPVKGLVGLRLIDSGNIVQTTDTTGIATIATISPITVVFSLPEDSLPQVLKQVNAEKTLSAEAYDRGQSKLLAKGALLAIDNEIDPTTGTVKLKAKFGNEDGALFPSQFVNIHLLVDTLRDAITIPTAAIQHGSQGPFVFAIDDTHIAKVQPVTVGINIEDETVITSNLSPDLFVATEGTDKLNDGSPVVTRPAEGKVGS